MWGAPVWGNGSRAEASDALQTCWKNSGGMDHETASCVGVPGKLWASCATLRHAFAVLGCASDVACPEEAAE